MKKAVLFITMIMLVSGCASMQKYVDQGLEAGKKAAERETKKYVDKQGGTGTFDDTMSMQDDQSKTDNLLPYYVAVNQMCDAQKIDEQKRDELKAQFDSYYAEWQEGTLTKEEYDQKCTECIDAAGGIEATE